jgi:DNA-binding MarR family transcriptional regulator
MLQSRINPQQLEYLYQTNAAKRLDNVADEYHRRIKEKLEAIGYNNLKLSYAAVLSRISFSGTRLVDVAEKNGMTKQAIGQLANEIEQLGYIQRIPDPFDGRAKNLVFTDLGQQLIQDSIQAVDDVEQEFAELIGEESIRQLNALITELDNRLAERAGNHQAVG